jgi:signal transduction histidine kinase
MGMAPDRLVRERRGERALDVFVSTLSDDRGDLLGLIELSVDMTGQEAQARSLAHAEKLNVVGQLASGVAHEINSPLDGAIEAARIIGGGELTPEELKNFARAQQSALERIAVIVRRLLTFSRRERTTRERVSARDTIGEAVELVRHRLSRGRLELAITGSEDVPDHIDCEALELSQVVVNLLSNAIDASPPGGVIRIEVTGREGWVEIVVSDQGPGVPDKATDRIFTPFFTTKEVGKGTGLGLAISKNIVENYGGRIEFENGPPPWGASFRVKLPATADSPSPERDPQQIKDARP